MKKITSLSLGFSFLIMSYTGTILYFVPKGKVAYWADWHFLGLSKTQYGDIHTTSMLTFLLFGILHIYYNWKPLMSYLKDKNKKISFTKKDLLIALGVNLFFVLGTLYMIQPLKGYLDLQEDIKDYWAKSYGEPPYSHAEESKLKVFCKKLQIDYDTAIKILKEKNIDFTPKDTIAMIAKHNGLSPNDIYLLIKTDKSTPLTELIHTPQDKDSADVPASLGRKTLQELSDLQKIDWQQTLHYFQQKEMTDVTKESKMKALADELETTPFELYKLLHALYVDDKDKN